MSHKIILVHTKTQSYTNPEQDGFGNNRHLVCQNLLPMHVRIISSHTYLCPTSPAITPVWMARLLRKKRTQWDQKSSSCEPELPDYSSGSWSLVEKKIPLLFLFTDPPPNGPKVHLGEQLATATHTLIPSYTRPSPSTTIHLH